MWKAFLFAALLTGAGAAHAADAREALVVTPDWLQSHLNEKNLVILAVGNEKGYHEGHISGARLVKGLLSVNRAGLTMELPSPEVLREKMEALGISDDSRIVVYNEGDEFQRGTRVMFSLEAAGFGDRSQLLDGGLQEWKRTGHATTAEAANFAPGHLSPFKIEPLVVDADFVKGHLNTPGYDLIDGRKAIFYGGLVAKLDGDGHIPGARSLPFSSVVDSEGKLKSPEQLKSLFGKAGYKPGDHVIAYCQVGGQSSAVLFAGRTIGIDAQLYDGSFQDWKKRHLPVETSSSPE